MNNQRNGFGMGRRGCGMQAKRGCGGGNGNGGGGCGRGGKREGAGRPGNGFCQRIQLRLTDEQKQFWLNNPDLQEEIRALIDKRMGEA